MKNPGTQNTHFPHQLKEHDYMKKTLVAKKIPFLNYLKILILVISIFILAQSKLGKEVYMGQVFKRPHLL